MNVHEFIIVSTLVIICIIFFITAILVDDGYTITIEMINMSVLISIVISYIYTLFR